jgi:hypothetical protein
MHLHARVRAQVKTYFNTDGFNRWKKIYGETDDVNKVQLDIRQGHAQTVEKVLGWLDAEGGLQGTTVCDAGCGTGARVRRPHAVAAHACALASSITNHPPCNATTTRRQPGHPAGAARRRGVRVGHQRGHGKRGGGALRGSGGGGGLHGG